MTRPDLPDYFARRSFAYDRNVGELIVKRLISRAAGGDASVERELLAEARSISRRALPPDESYFQPQDRYFAYAEVDTNPKLIETGKPPILR